MRAGIPTPYSLLLTPAQPRTEVPNPIENCYRISQSIVNKYYNFFDSQKSLYTLLALGSCFLTLASCLSLSNYVHNSNGNSIVKCHTAFSGSVT
ncbi:MAG: hypothetical protein F6K56_05165 [Moorea sp. SIO3G5]|nr:hypothetical protein [Moorena sp. SIO3G5]